MKKSYVPLFGLILLFGLSACGQEKGNEPVETVIVDTKTETSKEEKTPTPELKPTPKPESTPTPTTVETKKSDVVYHTDFTTDDNMWYNDTKGDEHGVGGVENGRYWMASAASKG